MGPFLLYVVFRLKRGFQEHLLIFKGAQGQGYKLGSIESGHPELLLLLSDLVVKAKGLMEWVCNYHFPCFILQDSSLGEKVTVGDFGYIVIKQFSRKSV